MERIPAFGANRSNVPRNKKRNHSLVRIPDPPQTLVRGRERLKEQAYPMIALHATIQAVLEPIAEAYELYHKAGPKNAGKAGDLTSRTPLSNITSFSDEGHDIYLISAIPSSASPNIHSFTPSTLSLKQQP